MAASPLKDLSSIPNYDIKILLVSGYTRARQIGHKIPDEINKIITRFYVTDKHTRGTRDWIFWPITEYEKVKNRKKELIYQSIIVKEKCFEELRYEDQYQDPPSLETCIPATDYSSTLPNLESIDNYPCDKCKSLQQEFEQYKTTATNRITDLSNELKNQKQIYSQMLKHNQSMNQVLCDKINQLQIQLDTSNVSIPHDEITQTKSTEIPDKDPNTSESTKPIDFNSMNMLRSELLDALDKLNYIFPSKIQFEAISQCLDRTDDQSYPNLIAQAHHGSGKTAAFTLIMLQRIDENISHLQGLVVLHSRELAIQTRNACEAIGQYIKGLHVVLAVKDEVLNLSWNGQICVGTPGTIMNHVINTQKRKPFNRFMNHFKILVIDEADEFLKHRVPSKRRRTKLNVCSLYDQLIQIVTDIVNCACNVQTLLFSATYPVRVKKLAAHIAPNAVVIKVAQQRIQLENIKIFKISCDEDDKLDILLKLISVSNIGQMIVFVNTVKSAESLVNDLQKENVGIACSVLYGKGMNVMCRDRTMDEFRKGQTQCLVASNLIARGIDVPAVGLVVNFEIPSYSDVDTFMHRVGRTGRFGAKGICINLVPEKDISSKERLDAIQTEYSLNITELSCDIQSIKDSISRWLERGH
eukprot:33693_1